MAPLDGSQYVDILFHYHPLQPEPWFREDNPENSVAPLGAITDCHEELEAVDPDRLLSNEEALTFPRTICTEASTGRPVDLPFLSLPVKRITSGNDLYEEWYSLSREKFEVLEREIQFME